MSARVDSALVGLALPPYQKHTDGARSIATRASGITAAGVAAGTGPSTRQITQLSQRGIAVRGAITRKAALAGFTVAQGYARDVLCPLCPPVLGPNG